MKNKNRLPHNPVSLAYLFYLIFLFLPTRLTAAKEIQWETFIFRKIKIQFTTPDRSNALQLDEILRENYPVLHKAIQFSTEPELDIYISPSQEIFNQLLGGTLPEWSEAVYKSWDKKIILNSPYREPSGRSFKATVIHELTHAVLDQRVHFQPIPRWLNEGLAVAFSGERELASSSLISKANLTNSLIPLNEIDEVLTFQRIRAQLAYQQSYLATQFLIDRYSFEAVNKILDGLEQGRPVDDIFQQTLSISFSEFEANWREHIRTERRWDYLIDFASLLWPLTGLLFLIAVVFIFLRSRRRLREWDDEENQSD